MNGFRERFGWLLSGAALLVTGAGSFSLSLLHLSACSPIAISEAISLRSPNALRAASRCCLVRRSALCALTLARARLRKVLGENQEKTSSTAEKWAAAVKPKTAMLDMRSNLFTAFSGLTGVAVAVVSFLPSAGGKNDNLPLLVTFWVALFVFIAMKFYIDKRNAWFKFVCNHLEAIGKGL